MKNIWRKSIAVIMTSIILFLCITNVNVKANEQSENNTEVFAELAFPTAEGKGKSANGFRGGKVVRVTNLYDSGEGSLRWALEEVSGSKIVTFAVGGVIELESEITIDEEHGNVYIAGQTAPGDGITIIKDGICLSSTNDVVIRNLRIRHGIGLNPSACIDIIDSEDCIVDHCSMSWSNGPVYNSRHSNNTTLQYSILSEPLIDALTGGVDDGPEGYYSIGTGILADAGSFHHNIVSNCMNRNICFWKIKNVEKSAIAIANNVFFNWNYYGFQWHSLSLDIVNNTLKKGLECESDYLFTIDEDYDGKLYFNGNILDNSVKDWDLIKLEGVTEEQLANIKYDEPVILSDMNIESAETSYEKVLYNSGAIVPELDDIDKRYIQEIDNGEATYTGSETGMKGFLNSVEDAEGFPDETTFKGGESPLDSDEDGIPNAWEELHGLDSSNPADCSMVTLSAEGYTNIEMYLNELMHDPLVWINEDQKPTPTDTPLPTENPPATEIPTEASTIDPTELPDATDIPEETEVPIQDILLGDVNKDGSIDSSDALAALKHAAKLESLSGEELIAADVTKDDMVDAKDSLEILKYAVKIISIF